jgi:protein-S-isoprenylcysteine O-methyltransferase Ste14
VTTLVTQGVFGWTRNPIYLGGSLALVGFALAFALDWVLMLWAASLPLLHYGVVLREEAYLARQFGDAFRSYCAAVPRWLWPFG